MAVFSTNQARHFYVVNDLKSPSIIESDPVGSVTVKCNPEKSHLYFEYKGHGGMMRSDLIDTKNIMYAKATKADAMGSPLKKFLVELNSNVNEGNPIAGQDYILRLIISQYLSLSEEDKYIKYGMVHATSEMTASAFYKALALSLLQNFSREEIKLFKFYLKTAAGAIEVTNDNKNSLTGTYKGVIIEEVPQDWILGIKEDRGVNFLIQPDNIYLDGEEYIWGTVTAMTPTIQGNGHKIADMEYFYLGERGDINRNIGWPDVIHTKYVTNPDKKYNTIDIHYSYIGANEGVQKSEKDITLAILADGATPDKMTDDIISAINAATGLNISTLSPVAPELPSPSENPSED